MRVLESRHLLRRYPRLEIRFPELNESNCHRAHEPESRQPGDSPDQRKSEYHRKEREEEADGGVTRHMDVHE